MRAKKPLGASQCSSNHPDDEINYPGAVQCALGPQLTPGSRDREFFFVRITLAVAVITALHLRARLSRNVANEWPQSPPEKPTAYHRLAPLRVFWIGA
jgi:hypothetical protein